MPNMKTGAAKPAKRRYARRLTPTDRREQLLDVALRIVADRGFSEVSMAVVAERAGVTRPVVYDSFGSSDELLEELIERETARMGEAVARSMTGVGRPVGSSDAQPAALRAALDIFLDEVRSMPDTWRLVYFPVEGVPPVLRERVEKARDELRGPLRQALGGWLAGRPADAAEVDLEILVRFVQSLVQSAARLVLDDPDHFDSARIVALFDHLFVDGS